MAKPILIDRSLRLPADQFYQESYPKHQLYIHHSVSGSVQSVYEWWLKDPAKVGTSHAIDQKGNIYEFFNPAFYANHLGINHKRNKELNQQSIGIELISEGALTMKDGKLFAFDGKQVFKEGYIDNQADWRGYRYFDSYEPAQIDSLYKLVEYLCEQHSIPKKCILQSFATTFDEAFFDLNGILGHANVRADKTDPNPRFRFDHLQAYLDGANRGEPVPIPE